ncbi:MAG: Gfo/Idh/MocA family oxidoreductase [Clostridia bacterium]|nr:Gfo/Idh/MocA family oxidoreductase [Clostridia bacterium]
MKTIAVIGCGRIAQNAHFPAFEKIEGLRVKYACDLIEEKAQAMKEKYAFVENVITDYNVALSDPEVEAVYVLTPNFAHYTVTMDALNAGKHVFCEKPIATTYALAKEMADKAQEKELILNIGVCNRYHKSVEMLEQMNREGKFGNLYHIYCSFRNFRSIPGLGGPFTDSRHSGGGVLIDWGIHFLDLILYILGGAKIKNVTCDTYNGTAKDMKEYKYNSMWAEDTADIENGVNDVEDYVTGYVRTDKATISFNGAWAQNINKDEMFIDFLGDKCGARLTYCGKFEVYDAKTLETINPEYDIPNMYECEDRAFLSSYETGIKDKNNIENILESMKLLDSLYQSAKVSEEIKL